MSQILACTDGSLYAPSIYQHATWAARKLNFGIRVLHMLNPHHERPVKTDYSGTIGFGAKSQLLEELVELEANNAKLAQKRGQAILDDAHAMLEECGVDVIAEQKHGKLSEEIGHYERDAELIVLGKRGNNANFETGHLGTNLERVIRSCAHPVLVTSREFNEPKNFVVAFDGGQSAKKAVAYLADSPLLKGAHCYLLYVGPSNEKIGMDLAEAERVLKNEGYQVTIEHRDGEPEKVIESIVAQDHIDLLVMGAYGHSHIRHLIVGSTTTAMIRAVQIPVLLFR